MNGGGINGSLMRAEREKTTIGESVFKIFNRGFIPFLFLELEKKKCRKSNLITFCKMAWLKHENNSTT